MGLVAAICPNCGAGIETNRENDAGICSHCGTAFITEKAIKQYITQYQTSQIINKTIIGKEKTEAEEYLLNAETFMGLEEYSKAYENYKKAVDANPRNYKSWLGVFRADSKNFNDNMSDINPLLKALNIANEKERQIILEEINGYCSALKKEFILSVLLWWDIDGFKLLKTKDREVALAPLFEMINSKRIQLTKKDAEIEQLNIQYNSLNKWKFLKKSGILYELEIAKKNRSDINSEILKLSIVIEDPSLLTDGTKLPIKLKCSEYAAQKKLIDLHESKVKEEKDRYKHYRDMEYYQKYESDWYEYKSTAKRQYKTGAELYGSYLSSKSKYESAQSALRKSNDTIDDIKSNFQIIENEHNRYLKIKEYYAALASVINLEYVEAEIIKSNTCIVENKDDKSLAQLEEELFAILNK